MHLCRPRVNPNPEPEPQAPTERLLSTFSCSYDPSKSKSFFSAGYRGDLFLFTSHVCFYGRSWDGKDTTRVLLLEHLVSLDRKMGSWGLGRLSSALILSTLDEELTFSAFWRPQTTLKALIEVMMMKCLPPKTPPHTRTARA